MGWRYAPPMQSQARATARRTRLLAGVAAIGLGTLIVLGGLRALSVRGGPASVPAPPATPSAIAASTTPVPSADAGSGAPPEQPVDMVAVGDIGRCDSTADDDTGRLAATLPGVIALLGDTAYPSGTMAELEQCFGASWGLLKDRVRFAVSGNHDDMTDRGLPLQRYLGAAAVRSGHTYFSEDLGAWHVVVLDANCGLVIGGCGPDSPQVRWLRDDLARSPARCTLALWHQPRWSSGDHGSSTDSGAFWDALSAAGADLVLNGHDHDYERFLPQDPPGTPDATSGITELVVGTGGGTLRPFGHILATSVARTSETFGVLALTLRPGGWSSRFVAASGTFTDGGDGTCH